MFTGFVQMSSIQKGMNDYLSFMAIPEEGNSQIIQRGFSNYQESVALSPLGNIERPVIEFEDVWFSYPNQKDFALKGISLKIPYGQKVSIVGENGAGKTTFIKLLTRLYKPTKGRVLVNGIDIQSLPIKQYRRLLSVVFQDFSIFAFTIKDNIVLNDNPQKEDDERSIEQIIEQVGLSKKVHALSSGVDTYIETVFDSDGVQLSGGELQRIALARSIYRNAPILILDEPTASLDPRAEHEIYQNYYDISYNKTTFFISHRLANSQVSDRILVFEHGQIVEDGNHKELLSRGGLYSELFNMQKGYYLES